MSTIFFVQESRQSDDSNDRASLVLAELSPPQNSKRIRFVLVRGFVGETMRLTSEVFCCRRARENRQFLDDKGLSKRSPVR